MTTMGNFPECRQIRQAGRGGRFRLDAKNIEEVAGDQFAPDAFRAILLPTLKQRMHDRYAVKELEAFAVVAEVG